MKVLIIGAGVGGPVLALALHQAGHEPILVDRLAPVDNPTSNTAAKPFVDFGDVGGGFSLLHGPLRFLRSLGLLERLRAIAFNRTTAFAWHRMDGSTVYTWDPVAHAFDPDLRYTAQVLRSALQRVVMARVAELGIRVVTGRRLVSVAEDAAAGIVTATFADGGEPLVADVLVGADGMHSAVRRAVFGDALRAAPDRMRGFLGVTDFDERDGWREGEYVRFFAAAAIKKRLAVIRVSETDVFWEITEYGDDDNDGNDNAASGESGGGDPGEWRATAATSLPGELGRLADAVASWGAPAGIVALVRRSRRLTPLAIYDAPRLASFARGRVVLIGDAAHGMPPHLGQGLTMAYGDAAVLAEALAAFPSDHARAFALYDKLRVPAAHAMSDRTHKFGEQNFPSTALARWLGEATTKAMAVVFNYFNLITVLSSDYKEDVRKELAAEEARSASASSSWSSWFGWASAPTTVGGAKE
ncbi:hypothetical protein DFJ73DRAFT_801015 [Zopfochytrium polystomum]|nr:hypothetical protein DFJ73DRAFT_801015 [Zopfochytrium polystomum]